MGRINKEDYYLNIAKQVAMRSTCIKRSFGAVIVKEDQIISTGYCGAARKLKNCIDIGECLRLEIPEGKNYELCRSVHAEQNAIIHASRLDMLGSSLYLAGFDTKTSEIIDSNPCKMCKRSIINAGINEVILLQKSGSKQEYIQKWIDNQMEEIEFKDGKYSLNIKNGY